MKALQYEKLKKKERAIIKELYVTGAAAIPPEFKDEESSLEWLAHQYRNQLKAFQEILTEQGYQPAREAEIDYPGQIAAISYYGTLIMLGKPILRNRITTTNRIHTPSLVIQGKQAYLEEKLALGKSAELNIIGEDCYASTPLRGLAINTAEIEDERTHHARTMIQITRKYEGLGETTMRKLLGKE